jgi:hypothetical protein
MAINITEHQDTEVCAIHDKTAPFIYLTHNQALVEFVCVKCGMTVDTKTFNSRMLSLATIMEEIYASANCD